MLFAHKNKIVGMKISLLDVNFDGIGKEASDVPQLIALFRSSDAERSDAESV
jgi:hypothetical protein